MKKSTAREWTEQDLWNAAEDGTFHELPRRMLSAANMLIQDDQGRTPLHQAANCWHLDQLPREILTPENMLVPEWQYGDTPLHEAAACLQQVPKEILTAENLLLKAFDGSTPLHNVAKWGKLDLLLGTEFPKSAKRIVGADWWNRNLAVINLGPLSIYRRQSKSFSILI